MRRDRQTGLIVLGAAAAALGTMSGQWLVPVLALAVGAAGAFGWVRLRITRQRELILMLGVAVAFAALWRLAPYEPQTVRGLVLFSVMHALGQFWLAWMALKLMIERDDGLSIALPVLAVAVFVAAGDVYVDAETERVYQLLSLALVCSMMLFFASRRRVAGHASHPRATARRVTVAVALGLSILGGVMGSSLLYHYQRQADMFIRTLSLRWVPSTGIGFSSVSRLGDLDELRASQMADRVSLRVVCDERPGYLRGIAYDTYRNSRWYWDSKERTIGPVDAPPHMTPLPVGTKAFEIGSGQGPWRTMDVWPAPDRTEAIFAPLHAAWLAAPTDNIKVTDARTLASSDLPAGAGYRVLAPHRAPPQTLTPAQRARYTATEEIDPMVHEIAADLFQGLRSTREKTAAVEEYFHKNFTYRIGIHVPKDKDPLTWFLTEKPGAHCEYFATAAVILLRLGGVPCRYITGFVTTEHSEGGGYWVARNRDAHAWVEAWDDRDGWMLVEPTPPAGLPQPRERGAAAWVWDWLKLKWQQTRNLLMVGGFGGVMSWLGQQVMAAGRWLIFRPAGWAVLAGVAAVAVLWWRRKRRSRDRQKRQSDPVVRGLQVLLERMDKLVARRGLVRPPGQTLHAFAQRLLAPPPAAPPAATVELQAAAQWYLAYANARYDPQRQVEQVRDLQSGVELVTTARRKASPT